MLGTPVEVSPGGKEGLALMISLSQLGPLRVRARNREVPGSSPQRPKSCDKEWGGLVFSRPNPKFINPLCRL